MFFGDGRDSGSEDWEDSASFSGHDEDPESKVRLSVLFVSVIREKEQIRKKTDMTKIQIQKRDTSDITTFDASLVSLLSLFFS